ncbi:glycoside hydrolase family 7 protein [Athelia psychrophila]|uniref:Glucanase n=1 Tax=Athelia psychrophila TaxID=1759441 RepID=A0A166S518_9AGAM|nr:glycoside hydrolase family 7 protein [Fibularhizoctonia sp. CBS 109695]
MFPATTLLGTTFLAAGRAQQVGTLLAGVHPTLTWETCTANLTIENFMPEYFLITSFGSYTNSYTGNEWDATLCPDAATCPANCALDGANYSGTYGVTTGGASLKLDLITDSAQPNVGSRLYLMASNTDYEISKPLSMEFTFDVDVSYLPCSLNGALYFSEMSADDSLAAYSGNKAGAEYGTGYCDSQCARDLRFINGVANDEGWIATSASGGTGKAPAASPLHCLRRPSALAVPQAGTAAHVTPTVATLTPTAWANTGLYGPSKTVDTAKLVTVVTQFVTSDNTSSGTLTAIKCLYVQNGVVI